MGNLCDLPLKERPLERLYALGPGALGLTEILASLIGGGYQIEIANFLLQRYGSATGIARAPIQELQEAPHLGRAGAARLKAALELGRRLASDCNGDRPQIRSPADVSNLLMLEMKDLDKEHFRLVILDTKNYVLATPTIYIGNANTAIIRTGEVIREALRYNSVGVIAVHNHPSGDPAPSPEDVHLTERLCDAFRLIDVDLLDHVVIGNNYFVSMKERGLGFKG